ncbi:hypothetical protein AGMMS50239_37890 [Bacteroidia bacterium]|nr:hypothetical protein AGMMS50239_37890 [Bacteroidia bacterium]
MKRNLFFLSMIAIALITGSCSNDLDEGQTPAAGSSGQAITFKTWANKPLRALPTQAADVVDFAVLATDPTAAAAAQVLIDGALVSGSNTLGWTYSPTAYWPETATVNFYAYSPAVATGVAPLSSSAGTGSPTALTGQKDVNTGEPGIEFTLPTTPASQQDLLVAHHSSTYGTDGSTGVPLTFRHALSRVKFQAKSESAQDFIVQSIKLKNLKGKATLDLSALPRDGAVFAYPSDNATVASPGYQTYWVPDGAATAIDLEATLSETSVLGATTGWTDIVDGNDALYIIPQTNVASDLPKATPVTGADPSSLFYIEITYKEDDLAATPVTYAVPVPAIAGDAYASSIAFEMEREYTFQFELFGKKPIVFTNVVVSTYSTVTQEEPLRLQWAGSNIYWNGTKLTFDDSNEKTNEQYQGVYFKWGSLVGIAPAGDAWPATCYFPANPGVDETWTTDATTYPNYLDVPYVDDQPVPYGRGEAYLTTITKDAATGPTTIAAYKGDICVYLTNIGAAPKGKRWRMPTSLEFGAAADYIKVDNGFAPETTQNAEGTTAFTSGYRRNKLNTPYFPASGYRYYSTGALTNAGTNGIYWSSSPNSNVRGYHLGFSSPSANPTFNNYRTSAFSVRCVAE